MTPWEQVSMAHRMIVSEIESLQALMGLLGQYNTSWERQRQAEALARIRQSHRSLIEKFGTDNCKPSLLDLSETV